MSSLYFIPTTQLIMIHFPITGHVPHSIPFTLSNYYTCATLHSFHTFQLLDMYHSPFLSHFPITVHVPLSIPFTLSNYCTCTTLHSFHAFQLLYMCLSPFLSHFPITVHVSLSIPFTLSNYCTCATLHSFHTFHLTRFTFFTIFSLSTTCIFLTPHYLSLFHHLLVTKNPTDNISISRCM